MTVAKKIVREDLVKTHQLTVKTNLFGTLDVTANRIVGEKTFLVIAVCGNDDCENWGKANALHLLRLIFAHNDWSLYEFEGGEKRTKEQEFYFDLSYGNML